MDDRQIAAYLQEMERQAVSYRDSDLAEDQATAIDFYEAQPFGDEEEGRSQVVVPVVQEVCDYMTVSVLRTFISGDRVVEFEPKSEDTEAVAEEASEAINFVFMNEQAGKRVLHDWLKCGLVERICAIKTMCVQDERRTRRTITLTSDELAGMSEDDVPEDLKVIAVTDNGDDSFTVKVETTRKRKRYIDLPIPNYELLFSPRTRHEDESEYIAHRCKKTLSDLIEMGFDRDKVENMSAYDNVSDSRENATWGDEWHDTANDNIPGLRKVTLLEEYARIDWDGDGKAELIRVQRVGNVILDVEEVDENPFVVFCPFPRPHRLVGNSLADKVMDIQRNKSVVMRQSFDAMYLSNDPKLWLPAESTTDDTIDDLLTKGPGVIVRGRGARPEPLVTPYDIGKTISMMDLLSGEQESRTGITRLNQGLDAEAMNKTATGMALQSSQGQQIEEFVALQFADALARLFVKKLRLMIEHGDPIALRIDGEFREADPSTWDDDLTVNVRVGLGSGKKDQRIQGRMMIAQLQADAFASGTGLVDERGMYNTGAGIVRDLGLGDPNDYFIDPDAEPEIDEQTGQPKVKEEKPDPEAMKVQAEMQMQQAKLQGEQQLAEAKLQGDQASQAAKIEHAREEAALKQQLAREQAEFEAGLAIEKMEREHALELQRMEREAELEERRMAREERVAEHSAGLAEKAHDAKLSANRAGGALDK
jgi:hypothetical protein